LKINARIILGVDNAVDTEDLFMVAWQILGNSDPGRDIRFISDNTIHIDGTIKAFRDGGFPRKWPNVVCSSDETIRKTDQVWEYLGIGALLASPSAKYSKLSCQGNDEVLVKS
jgi:3-polyprenyl-4-hydroxybenzoate decarboxylase